ncbi:hypothetical protein [Oryzibacter oryziterrae]|uniref:hypothetical protein n=1 Tax=Oryzibacter oryziterrae TaxID=2766474 RepID=UPI001F268CD8|nr:hypothetical protein [Oryzibacter oryziterrae]
MIAKLVRVSQTTALAALLLGATGGASAMAASSSVIPGTKCPNFPANSWWHADISALPRHAKSNAWMAHMSSGRKLHPDFGPSYGELTVPYGIPITVVSASHAKVKVTFGYADQSDAIPYPLGADTKVEGGQWTSGDRHTIVVDKDTCRLYETWATNKSGSKWSAGSGASWLLTSNTLRRKGWTSADAAGLPILPGLLRYDEVKALKIDHAIRFTTDVSDRSFLWPARHQAGGVSDSNYPPMGARFRLKASFTIDPKLRPDTRAILKAFKTYGLVLADNGSSWFFQGTADTRWPEALLDELKSIPASAFEAVDTSSLKVSDGSMQVKP